MRIDRKAIHITVVGGLAALLLTLVVVLMLNPAAASGSGDWPPPATGDWVINQPTTVIDESWVYLSDQNIIVNSDLTIYNSYVYMDDWTWPPTMYTIKVAAGATLVTNETEFDSWSYTLLQVDGTMYASDTIFWYLQDFNISARGAAYVDDYSRFRFINHELNVLGALELEYSYIDQTYFDINVDGTMEMNHSSIYNTMNDFNIDGSMEMYYSYIYDTYNDVNIGGSLYMNSSRIYYSYNNINVDGTLDMEYYSYLYYTYTDLNVTGDMSMVQSYVNYVYHDINIDGTLDMDGSTIDEARNNITVTGALDTFRSYLTDCYGTLVISGTSTMDDMYIDDIDRGFWISGKVYFNDTDIRYVNYAFNVSGSATFDIVRFYRIYDGMNLMGTVDMADCTLQYVYMANFTGAVDIGNTYFYRMYEGIRLTGDIDIDTCDFDYVYYGVYIGSDISIANVDIYYMYYQGFYIDHCSPTLDNVTIYGSSTNYDYYTSTDHPWSIDNRFPMAVGTGIWVDGGTPTFRDVVVESDMSVNFRVDYTGSEEEVELFILGMVCPVLIDSTSMTTVSGITVMNSVFNMRSYITATDPGPNPRYMMVNFMGMAAGIGVVNYDDVTITDVMAYGNYYSSIYGPYVYNVPSYGTSVNFGPNVMVGTAIFGDYDKSPGPSLTVRDMTVDDGTDFFGHMYFPNYVGTGSPVFDDTILIDNVTVMATDGYVFGIQVLPMYADVREINVNLRMTGCDFTNLEEGILYYTCQAGPGTNPNVKMVDGTETIKIDNNSISECWNPDAYFFIEGVWDSLVADNWDRTVTFSDNKFMDTWGIFFDVTGVDGFSRGTDALYVVNNRMKNATDDPDYRTGPFYSWGFDTVRFMDNMMEDMAYGETGDFYDWGGDPSGVNPVDWLFKDNFIQNCVNERWSEIIFLEFGGHVTIEGNDISMGNGFVSMYHQTVYTGSASLDILSNVYHDMSAYIVEFGNVDAGNLNFVVTVKDNEVYGTSGFFLNFWGNSGRITANDYDPRYIIEDNVVHNNTNGFIHVWGDVTLRNNDFSDNQGPILMIEYINRNKPKISGNSLVDNVDLFVFVGKDRGYQRVSMSMANTVFSCSGTAFSFTNMEVTLDSVDIMGADMAILAINSVVEAYTCSIDGDACKVMTDGMINNWWPIEVKATWGDANGADSGTPVANALVVFYDSVDDYVTSSYAGMDGMLPRSQQKEWTVSVEGIHWLSPYTIKVASSGATNSTRVTLNTELVGALRVNIVLWDIFKPVVSITDPFNGQVSNKDSMEALGFATEVGSGLSSVEYFDTDASAWKPLVLGPGGDWSIILSSLPEGEITIKVRAKDIASNSAETSVMVTIDTMAPDLTLGNTPEITNKEVLLITGTVEEGVELFVNGESMGMTASNQLQYSYDLSMGYNIIIIEVMDAAGNIAFDTITVTLDKEPPVIVLVGPADGTVTNAESIVVMGVVQGFESLTVAGTPVIPDEDGTFKHTVTLSEGNRVIEVKATDRATNMATATLHVFVDRVPPVVQITAPANNTLTSVGVIDVTMTADDDAMLWLNGRPIVNEGGMTKKVLLLEGKNTITLMGKDPAGNMASTSIDVYLDTVAPSLEVTMPSTDMIYTNSMTLRVEGTAMNADDVRVGDSDADEFDPVTGAFSHDLTLMVGTNDITITASDELHQVSYKIRAMVRTGAPKLVVDTVDPVVTTPSVTIKGETDPGITILEVEVKGETMSFPVKADGKFAFTLNLADDDGYNVEVSVTDAYGNSASGETGTFSVKQKSYLEEREETGGFEVSPLQIGLLLAVIGIALIVAAFVATYKISRRGE